MKSVITGVKVRMMWFWCSTVHDMYFLH